jgi:MarR family transcriptional regulator, transcriptional regulator for hemolysin
MTGSANANYGFCLTDAARLYMRCVQRRSRKLRLDLRQCRTLIALSENEGVTQMRLAHLSAIPAATLSRVVDRMQAGGWIERRSPVRDRRAWSLTLTQKGRAVLPSVQTIIDESQREAFSRLSANELKALIQALSDRGGQLLGTQE